MLVTFMDDHWQNGRPSIEAAIVGAGERLRPILMTACAMTVGMVPMALALERGSQMQAPLGLAVIGGLVMSTFATLLVLPSIFAIVIGKKIARSPSMYPDDKESLHYDPHAFDHVDENDPEIISSPDDAAWDEEKNLGQAHGAGQHDAATSGMPPPQANGHGQAKGEGRRSRSLANPLQVTRTKTDS
jgi:hypothetical protein